jgi:hypothetical protein
MMGNPAVVEELAGIDEINASEADPGDGEEQPGTMPGEAEPATMPGEAQPDTMPGEAEPDTMPGEAHADAGRPSPHPHACLKPDVNGRSSWRRQARMPRAAVETSALGLR